MKIVGVGQMFNFQTGQVEDRVQIVSAAGAQFSIPTSNEGAALLVKMAMAARQYPTEEERAIDPTEEYEDEGVAVFGGGMGVVAPPQSTEGHMDQEGDDWDAGSDDDLGKGHTQMFEKTAPKQSSLGRRSNPPDRSGVPSHGISRVDEHGNPILPAAPVGVGFEDDEEDDDPGESI